MNLHSFPALALSAALLAGSAAFTQQAAPAAGHDLYLRETAPSAAMPLPQDRGTAALEQSLRRLGTTASVLMIEAHPDDEDGALLTYLSRGQGARVTLFTLTRGEGGQNAMSADTYDALGLIRTNELLKADQYYGVKQLWGTEADFGFSKTQEEAFSLWTHDRVLYDAVLAVRRERPQIVLSTFLGGITDGHGHHQVAGEIAQEVFLAAGDPKVFPEQHLDPWQPLAVYSMVPFAPVTGGKMFDYATGKWAPARFKNYITGEWTTQVPSTDVSINVGALDPVLGQSYAQIARQGWGEQKSQNGGADPELIGPVESKYHLWAAVPQATPQSGISNNADLFHNAKVEIGTGVATLARLAGPHPPAWLVDSLQRIDSGLSHTLADRHGTDGTVFAHRLSPLYKQTLDLRARVASSSLDSRAKNDLLFELDLKAGQFQTVLANLLGLDLAAYTANPDGARVSGPQRGSSPDETGPSVHPGQDFQVQVHTAQATKETRLARVWLETQDGPAWKFQMPAEPNPEVPVKDTLFGVSVPEDAPPTAPYFTRLSIEQPYYDLLRPEFRERSFAPDPLAARTEFTFDGLPVRLGQVVQTMHRVPGPGGISEPLVVTPAIGLAVDPAACLLPLNGSALPVHVTVHTETAAEGTVELKLPAGWRAEPAQANFRTTGPSDTEPIVFSVSTDEAQTGAYSIQAIAHSAGHDYSSGWRSVGYPGLRPYNLYAPALLKTRKVDVKLAPGLRIGYVMGTGDLVPEAIRELGAAPQQISAGTLATTDLSQFDTIMIGIRAYSAHPELSAAQPKLDEFVRRGGTLVVEYQSANFPAPMPLTVGGRMPERVVDEHAPVKLLDPANPLFSWPNKITPADFDGWVEERGHSFLASWDPAYTALTETADPGQNPQRGGLLIAHPGKGTYIYVAYALYRQLPELVPGAYRLLANLLSATQSPK